MSRPVLCPDCSSPAVTVPSKIFPDSVYLFCPMCGIERRVSAGSAGSLLVQRLRSVVSL